MEETQPSARVVVGVMPKHSEQLLVQAARFAGRFHAKLICAYVDVSRYVVDELPDGTVRSLPIDPDLVDDDNALDPRVEAEITSALKGRGVTWETRVLAGDPARALAHLADTVDAEMIVVGTREPNFRGSVRKFFNGSVAAHLAHRQHRPVVVIPLDPVDHDRDLPWAEGK